MSFILASLVSRNWYSNCLSQSFILARITLIDLIAQAALNKFISFFSMPQFNLIQFQFQFNLLKLNELKWINQLHAASEGKLQLKLANAEWANWRKQPAKARKMSESAMIERSIKLGMNDACNSIALITFQFRLINLICCCWSWNWWINQPTTNQLMPEWN